MPDNQHHVEVGLELDPSGLKTGLEEAESLMRQGVQRMAEIQGQGTGGSLTPGPTLPSPPPPPPPASTPFGPTPGGFGAPVQSTLPGMAEGGGSTDKLDQLHQRLNIIQQMSQQSPDIARANLSRLQTQTLNASLREPERAPEYQELIDAIRDLTGEVGEGNKDGKDNKDFFNWIRANAGMQLGGQVMRQAQSGNLLSAAGTGAGGLLGLLVGGPAGMAMGSAIGGGLGGIIEGLAGGASGVRAYERDATDMARRFGGLGSLGSLRDYNLGGQYGFRAEESLGMIDSLRQERVIGSAAEGREIVPALQQLTRALGLNADATTKLYSGYVQTGGERGEAGLRQYVADVVGGAIAAGFENQVDQYAEMLGSARMQVVQGSGVGVSDRASRQLQDVLANLTGGGSDTARLFRDNPFLAQQGLGVFQGMGGTTDPYGMAAGFLRLAGVQENQIDRRFTTSEQQNENSERALQFLSARLLETSGMSASEFRAGAQADSNFVQQQMAQNVGLQRQVGDFLLPGLLGREASAGDIRAFEQLSNIMIANNGELPGASAPGGEQVQALLAELGMSEADEARQAEAERHNKQMEVMSHFQGIMTRMDQWMANIYDFIQEHLNLEEINAAIHAGMDWIERGAQWVAEAVPKVFEMADAVIQWAENNDLMGKLGTALDVIVDIIKLAASQVAEVARIILRPREALASARENPLGALGAAGRGFWERTGPGFAMALLRRRGDGGSGDDGEAETDRGTSRRRRGGQVDDEFGDTPPGGVLATESYNTFRFAPGDRVSARQVGPEFQQRAAVTLEDVNRSLFERLSEARDQHTQALEAAGELLDVGQKTHDLTAGLLADSEEATKKQRPNMMESLTDLIGLGTEKLARLVSIENFFPLVLDAIADVADAIASMQIMGGGYGGGGGGEFGLDGSPGAFASGLYTGPEGYIGVGAAYHIDSKFSRDLSWDEITDLFDQMAHAYEEQGRRIEFSNRGVAGEVYDLSASREERTRLLQRADAAHSHSVHSNWYSLDYYIPEHGDTRHGPSAEGAEMMLPVLPGGRVAYGSGGGYGNYAMLYDAQGREVMRTGHGDNRQALPSGRSFPTAPPPQAEGGGGGVGGSRQGLTVKGQAMTQEQFELAQTIAQVGRQHGASQRDIEGAIATAIQESTLRNLTGGDRDSLGIFQQRPSMEWGTRAQISDPRFAAESFFRGRGSNIGLMDVQDRSDIYRASHRVQRSAHPDAPRQWDAEARRITEAILGGSQPRPGSTAQPQRRGSGPQASAVGAGGSGAARNFADQALQAQAGLPPERAGAGGDTQNFVTEIRVSIDGVNRDAGEIREAAYQGVAAATDEFEKRWRKGDDNPRNKEARNPIFA